jgi:hypothetical protein
LYVTLTDPALSGWNIQNQTPSPPLGDLILSLSPALIIAIALLRFVWPKRTQPEIRLLLSWFVIGLVLVYIPLGLQRRFMTALFIPVVGLAVVGVSQIPTAWRRTSWIVPTLVVLSLPTNLILLAVALFGGISRDPAVFITADEAAGMNWISRQAGISDLVLSAPETGTLIPAHTGRRVIYGHPFETVNASQEKKSSQSFYDGVWDEEKSLNFLTERGVNEVFYGPREKKLGNPAVLKLLPVIYQQGDVTIYGSKP